jgi:dTDP-glucose pyrophosphorylase
MSLMQNYADGKLSESVWRQALLTSNATLEQAVRSLDQSATKIVLIVSESGELLGTVSDGDIRRGILRGLGMESSIESVIQRNPLVVPPEMARDLVLQLMVANKVQQIPVVDEQRRVVGLHIWDEITAPQRLTNPILVMAGGMGMRLRPHTENCPKPLLPVADKPILEHIIERAKLEGFTHFIIAIHYLGHMIEDYCGDGSRWKVKVEYLREFSPLGTAGALGLLTPRPEVPFIVTNGDVLTDIQYSELLDFHIRHDAKATMAVRLHEWQHPFGVVQTRGIDIVGFEEKPVARTHVNAGIYVLDPEALNELGSNEHCDMPTLFERLQGKGLRTVAYPMHEPWLDVGRPDDLEAANIRIRPLKREKE